MRTETVAPAAPTTREAHPRRAAVAVAVGLVVLYAAVSVVFVVWGRLNADEGWYLYAGRLAWRGQLPYRDFAFPQMPLTAYVYGLAQAVHRSLYLGRVTSVVLGVSAVALYTRVAWRQAGHAAGVAVAALCVALPVGVYNLTLTKTYALTAFLLAVMLTAFTSTKPTARTWPVATAVAFALVLTRTTAIPLLVVVVLWCLARAPDRATRRSVAIVTGVGTAVTAGFLLADTTAARYSLVTYHNLLWHGASQRTRVDTIVHDRIPDWLEAYPGYVALGAAAFLALYLSPRLRDYLRRQPGVALVGIGLVGALVVQVVAGEWAPVEYATPVIPAFVTVAVIMLTHALRPDGGWSVRPWLAAGCGAAVAALAVSTLFHPGPGDYFVATGSAGSVNAANRVGNYVHDHTRNGDDVLTLWAQPAGLVSGRDQVPNVTAGIFSYEDLSTSDAKAVKFVNTALLQRMLRDGRPAAVVITGIERDLAFHFTGSFSGQPQDPRVILGELAHHYRLTHRDVGWGTDGPIPVEVYLRDDRVPRS